MFLILSLFLIGFASCQLPACSLTKYNYVYSSDDAVFIQPNCDSVITKAVLSQNLPDGLDLTMNGTITGKSYQFLNNTEYSLTLYNENQKFTVIYFKLSIWQNPYCGYPNSGTVTISPNLPVYIHIPTCIFQFDHFEVGSDNFPSSLQLDSPTGKITGYIDYDSIPENGTETKEDGTKVITLTINVINPVKQYPIKLVINVLPTSKLMNKILALVTNNDIEPLDTQTITSKYEEFSNQINNGQIPTYPTLLDNMNIECLENEECTVFTGGNNDKIYTKNYIIKFISTLSINTEETYTFTITKNDDEIVYFYIDNILQPVEILVHSLTLTVGYHPLMILIFHTSTSSDLLFKIEYNVENQDKQILTSTICKTQYPTLQSYSYTSHDIIIALNQNVKFIPTIIGTPSSIMITEQLPNDLTFDMKTGIISGQASVKLDEKKKYIVAIMNAVSSLAYSFTLDIIEANKESLRNGIEAKYYLISSSSSQKIHKMTRIESVIDYNIIDKDWNKLLTSQYYNNNYYYNNGFYVEWNSYLYIPEDSNYYIKISSSDESILTINNTLILENNNNKRTNRRNRRNLNIESSLPVYLTTGLIKINIQYYYSIETAYSTPEISLKWYNDKSIKEEQLIPKEYYYYIPSSTFTYLDMRIDLNSNVEMLRINKPLLYNINNDETVTFTVLPPLPDSLQLDSVSGEISGKAILPQLPSYYVITAKSEKYGNYYTTVFIEVTNTVKPSNFNYLPSNSIELNIGEEIIINTVKPTIYNEIQNDYYFYTDKSLPLGLYLNNKNGVIYGIPREYIEEIEVNIYCSNSGGITKITEPLHITINKCKNNRIPLTLEYFIKDKDVEISIINNNNNELIYKKEEKEHQKDTFYEITKCVENEANYNLHIKTKALRGMWYKIYQNTNELIRYNQIEDLRNNSNYYDFNFNFNIINIKENNNDNIKPIIIYPFDSINIVNNLPFSYIPICQNGCTRFEYIIIENEEINELPNGMLFNTTTGEISGVISNNNNNNNNDFNLNSIQIKGYNNEIESEIVTLKINHELLCDNNRILFKIHIYSNNGKNILIKLSDLNNKVYLYYEGFERNVNRDFVYCLDQNQYEIQYGSTDLKPWSKYSKIEIYKFNQLNNILEFNSNNGGSKKLIIPLVYEVNDESAWQKVTKQSSIDDNSWNRVYNSDEFVENYLQNMPSRDSIITYYRTLFKYSGNKQNLITIDVIVKSQFSFIIYLNGEEFYRKNLPKINPTFGIKTDSILVYYIHASPLLLMNGDNILSIAIYQDELVNYKEELEVDLTFNYQENDIENIENDCFSLTNKNNNIDYSISTNKENNEELIYLFDNNFNSEYSTVLYNNGGYLLITLNFNNFHSFYLSDYIWEVMDLNGYNTENIPNSWVLYGSYSIDKDNKENWDIIDKVLKDEICKTASPKYKKYSTVFNKYKSYDYYIMEIIEVTSSNNNNNNNNIVEELQYFKARELNYLICKPKFCPRDSSYPLSYINENVKGSCPDRYVGFKIRQCTINGWSNEYNGCTAIPPSNLQYNNNKLIAFINHEIIPIKPSYDGYIKRFFIDSSSLLPSGLYINETTGIIYGTPTSLTGENGFKSVKINGNGENGEITIFELLITINSDECNSIGSFPNTKLGLTASVKCGSGKSGYMTRKCEYINNKPIWGLIDDSKCYNKQSPNCIYSNATFYYSINEEIGIIKPKCEFSFIKASISKELPSTMIFNSVDGTISGFAPENSFKSEYKIRFETVEGGYDEIEIIINVFMPIKECKYQYIIDEINDIYPTFPSNKYIEIYPPICDGDVAKYELIHDNTETNSFSEMFLLDENSGILSGKLISSSEFAFITISLRMINPSNINPIETKLKVKFINGDGVSLPPQRLNFDSNMYILGINILTSILPSSTDSILGNSNGMYSIEPEELESNLQFNQISGAIYGNPNEVKSNLKYCITYMGDYTSVQTCLMLNIIDVKKENLKPQIIAKYYFEINNKIECDNYIPPDQSINYNLIINRLEDSIDKSLITSTFWSGLSNDFINYFIVEYEGYIYIPFNGTYNFYINGFGPIRFEFMNQVNSVMKCDYNNNYNSIELRGIKFEDSTVVKFKLSYWKNIDTKKSIELLWSRTDLDQNYWSMKIIDKMFLYHFMDPIISYSTPLANYVLGKEIEINKPIIFFDSLLNENSSFVIIPSLPYGLKYNDKTGEIYGIPKEIVNNKEYTITVINHRLESSEIELKTTITITIQTYLPPSNFTYNSNGYIINNETTIIIGRIGTKIEPLYPTITSFKATWFYSNPTLPEGIILNENDGSISGIPIEISNEEYTVYAINAAGITSTKLTIIISSCPLGSRLITLKYYIDNNDDFRMIIQSNNNNNKMVYYDSDLYKNEFIKNYNYSYYQCIPIEENENGLNFIFKCNSYSVGHFDLLLDDLNVYSYNINNKEINMNKNILLNGGKSPIVDYTLNQITIQPYSYYYLSPFVQYGASRFILVNDSKLPNGLILNNETGEISGKVEYYSEKSEINVIIEISNQYGNMLYSIDFYINLCEENEVFTRLIIYNIDDSKDMILSLKSNAKSYFEFDRSFLFKNYSFSVCISKEPIKLQIGSMSKILWNVDSYVEFYINDELFGVYKYTNNDNNYIEYDISTFNNYINNEYTKWYISNEYRENWNNINGNNYNKNHQMEQCILYRIPETNKITTYLSTSFSFIDDLSLYSSILIKLAFIKGIIFYINGDEVFRYNMGSSDNINENTLSTSSSNDEISVSLTVPMVYIENGINIFAFEIHNSENNNNLLFTPKLRILMNFESLSECIDLDYSTLNVDKGSSIDKILDNDKDTYYSLRMRRTFVVCIDDNKFPITFQLNLGSNKYDYTNQVQVMGSTLSGSQPSAFDIFEKDTKGIWQNPYHTGSSNLPINGNFGTFNYFGNKYFSNMIQYKVANYQNDQCGGLLGTKESFFQLAELRIQRCPESSYYCKNSDGYPTTMANKRAIKKCNKKNEVGYMLRECVYENNEVFWRNEEENHCRSVLSTSFKYSEDNYLEFYPNKNIEYKPIISDDGGYNGFEIISGTLPKGINFDSTTGIISGVVPDIDYYSKIVISMKSIEPNPFTSFIMKIEKLGCEIKNEEENVFIGPNEYYYTDNCDDYYIGKTKQKCYLNETNDNRYELEKEYDYSECELAKPIIVYEDEYKLHINDKFEIIPIKIENRIDGEITIENLPSNWNFDNETATVSGILINDNIIIENEDGSQEEKKSEIILTIKYGNELYPNENVNIKIIILTEPASISYSSNILEFYIGFIDSYIPIINCNNNKPNCGFDRYEIEPDINNNEIINKYISFNSTTGELSSILINNNNNNILESNESYIIKGYFLHAEYNVEVQIAIIQPKCISNEDKYNEIIISYPGEIKEIKCEDPNDAGSISIECPKDIKQKEIEYINEINTCHQKYPQIFEYYGINSTSIINWYIGYEIDIIKCIVDSYNGDNSNLIISSFMLPDGIIVDPKSGDISGKLSANNNEVNNRIIAVQAMDETVKMQTFYVNIIQPKCKEDLVNNFKSTPENTLAVKQCEYGYNGLITRQCGSGKEPEWSTEIQNNCTMYLPVLIYTKDSTNYDETNKNFKTKFTVYQYEYYTLIPYKKDGIIDEVNINYLVEINENNTSVFNINNETLSIEFNFTVTGHYIIEIKLENDAGETDINLEIIVLPLKQKPESFNYETNILQFYNNFEDKYVPVVYNGKYDLFEFIIINSEEEEEKEKENNENENNIENIASKYNLQFNNKTGEISGKPLKLSNNQPIILNITVIGKYANNERRYELNLMIKIYRPYCESINLYPNTNAGEIATKECNINNETDSFSNERLYGYYYMKCSENRTDPEWLLESETDNCHLAYPREFSYPLDKYELYFNRKIEEIKPNYIIGNNEDEISKIVNNFTIISGKLPSGILLDNTTGIISGKPEFNSEEITSVKSYESVIIDLIIGYTIEQALYTHIQLIISYYLCPVSGKYPITLENTEITVSCDYGYSGIESRKCNENGAWDKYINKESCSLLPPDLDYSPKSYLLYHNEDSIQIKPTGPINKIDKITTKNLPPGIKIDEKTYIISGIPSLVGYYNSTIEFSNEKYSLLFNLEFTVNPLRPTELSYNNKTNSLLFYHGNNDSFTPSYNENGKIEYFNIIPNIETTINGLRFDRITGTIYGIVNTEKYLNKEIIEFTVYAYYSFNSITTKVSIQIEMPYCLPTETLPKKYAGQMISYGCENKDQVGDKYIKCSSDKFNPQWEDIVDDCRYPNPIRFEYNSSLFNLYIGHDLEIIPSVFEGRITFTSFTVNNDKEKLLLKEYGLKLDNKNGIISGNPTKTTIDPNTNETTSFSIEIEAKDDISIIRKISIQITQPMCPEDPILGFPSVEEGTKYKVQCSNNLYSGYAYRICGNGIEPKWDEYVNEENCIAPKPVFDYNPKEFIFGCNLDIDTVTPTILNNNIKIDKFIIVEGSLPLGLELDEETGEIYGNPYSSTSKPRIIKIQAFSGEFGSDIIELKFTVNILYCKDNDNDGSIFESVPIGFQSVLDCSIYMKSDDYEGTVLKDCPYDQNPQFSEVSGKCNLKKPTVQYLDNYYSYYVNISKIEIKPYKVSGKIDKYVINPSKLPLGLEFDEKNGIISGIGKVITLTSQIYEIYGINEESGGESNREKIEIKINKITCPSDGIWEESEVNSESIISCPKNYKYYITRKCLLKQTNENEYYGEWENRTISYCEKINMNIDEDYIPSIIINNNNNNNSNNNNNKISLVLVYPIMIYNLKKSFDINNIDTYKSILYTFNEVINNKNNNKNLTIIIDSKPPNNNYFIVNNNKLRYRNMQSYNNNNNDIIGIYAYIYSNEKSKSSIEAELKLKEKIFKETLINNPYTNIYKESDIEVGNEAIKIINENKLLENNNNNNNNNELNRDESNDNDNKDNGLNGGEIFGIIIGVIVIIVLIVVVIIILMSNIINSNNNNNNNISKIFTKQLKKIDISSDDKDNEEDKEKEKDNEVNNDNKEEETTKDNELVKDNENNSTTEKTKEKDNENENENDSNKKEDNQNENEEDKKDNNNNNKNEEKENEETKKEEEENKKEEEEVKEEMKIKENKEEGNNDNESSNKEEIKKENEETKKEDNKDEDTKKEDVKKEDNKEEIKENEVKKD